MTKEKLIVIRNASYEAMMVAHELGEHATSYFWKNFAESLYEAHFANYQLLCDKRFIALLMGENNAEEKG